MDKEGEPTRRAPIQENPASQFLRVLEEIAPTNETYSLQRATTLLNQLAGEMGVEVSVSHTTFRNWVALAMAEIIEPLAFLSQQELTSETFRKLYPDEKALPLSPTAFLFPKGGRRKNVLDIDDLKGVLSCAQRVYEKGPPEYDSAKETISLFQSKCFSLQEIGTILEIRGKDPLSFHKKLSQLILDGVLPLNHYPALLARTSGIPKEFFERELREQWQVVLFRIKRERERKLRPDTLIKYEFVPLSKHLRPLLKVRGFKLQNKHVPLLAIYFEEKDIWIRSVANKATGLILYVISCEAQKEIEKLLGEEPFQEEIERIASQGFTLEEYTQTYRSHFPDGTSIAFTKAIRLAGGPTVLTARKKIEFVKKLLQEKNISLKEKILIFGKQKIRLTYLPIEQLAEAVSALEKAFSADPLIFKLTQKNTSSLTSVLFQALGRKFAPRDYFPIYQQHLADIKGVIRVKRRDNYSYRVYNSQLQEVINSIRERQEAINQTLIEISGRKNEEGKQKDSF